MKLDLTSEQLEKRAVNFGQFLRELGLNSKQGYTMEVGGTIIYECLDTEVKLIGDVVKITNTYHLSNPKSFDKMKTFIQGAANET